LSEIRATTISDTAGTGPITLTGQAGSKAFTAMSPNTIHKSLNVSSLTDVSTGVFQYNVSNAFDSANYSSLGTKQNTVSNDGQAVFRQGNCTASIIEHRYYESGATVTDPVYAAMSTFGDLA
jgi:hypothetical protein